MVIESFLHPGRCGDGAGRCALLVASWGERWVGSGKRSVELLLGRVVRAHNARGVPALTSSSGPRTQPVPLFILYAGRAVCTGSKAADPEHQGTPGGVV